MLVSYEFECFARERRFLIPTGHAVEETVSRVGVQIGNELFVSVFGRLVDLTGDVRRDSSCQSSGVLRRRMRASFGFSCSASAA